MLSLEKILGADAEKLLSFSTPKIDASALSLPGSGQFESVFGGSDRNPKVIANLKRLQSAGRLGGTGYVSILPVDQSIEHSAGEAFAKNPLYFDPENIVKLAIEGGCNAVASRSACSDRWRASTHTGSRSL